MNRTPMILLLLALTLSACAPQAAAPTATPTALPTSQPLTAIPTSTPASATAPVVVESATQPGNPTFAPPTAAFVPQVTAMNNPYAVILVLPGDVLNIRSAAGVGHGIVGTLQPTASGVNRTGSETNAGGDRWVEIQNPAGGTGWVNAHFLTEQVSSASFCADPRVTNLLNSLKIAMLNADGELLGSLVSPVHGMDLRLWRYGTVANYSPKEAAWVFQSDYEVSWGPAPGSGEETRGTFNAQPLPKLTEVFGANYSLHCNDTLDLATFSLEPFPPEYANVNFYTVYKPGSETYGGLDWRAWTVGVEYVQGQPKLFSLIHYQWEP